MNFWEFLDRQIERLPGWPTERQWVTVALVAILLIMLQMAVNDPKLWDIKLFEILIQGFALTGLLNMVLAFHFAANKSDETKADNTAKAFDAITATATGTVPDRKPDVTLQPGQTAQAAEGNEL